VDYLIIGLEGGFRDVIKNYLFSDEQNFKMNIYRECELGYDRNLNVSK